MVPHYHMEAKTLIENDWAWWYLDAKDEKDTNSKMEKVSCNIIQKTVLRVLHAWTTPGEQQTEDSWNQTYATQKQ